MDSWHLTKMSKLYNGEKKASSTNDAHLCAYLLFQRWVHHHHDGRRRSRHGTGAVSESFTSWSVGRVTLDLAWALKCQPTPSDTIPPKRPHLVTLLSLSNSCTSWRPIIQLHELVRGHSYWNYLVSYPKVLYVNFKAIVKVIFFCFLSQSICHVRIGRLLNSVSFKTIKN